MRLVQGEYGLAFVQLYSRFYINGEMKLPEPGSIGCAIDLQV